VLSVPREERDRAARYTAKGTLRDPTIHAAILKGLHRLRLGCPLATALERRWGESAESGLTHRQGFEA
jgi:hypothetical protein